MVPNRLTATRFLFLMVFCGCVFLGSTLGFSGEAQLNLNTATVEQLEALPGIGPELAQRILEYRTQHGPFKNVDGLKNVKGVAEGKLAKLRDKITTETPAGSSKESTGHGH